MEAVEYLSQVKTCDISINNKMLEKEQWQTLATKTNCPMEGERVQSSGNPDKLSNAVIKIIEIEQEIDAMIDDFVDLKNEVTKVIDSIKTVNVNMYNILHKKYIEYMNLKQIAVKINYSYDWVVELHGQALDEVQKIIDSPCRPISL